jgi:heptosyltransferase-2
MITPMIRELRKAHPDAFIATLTQPYTKDVLLNNPRLDLTLTDDLQKDTFWETVHELRRHRFTDGLLVMPTERAAYEMFFAGIPNRVGVGRRLYEVITFMKSVSRHDYTPLRHEADFCMDLARKIGAPGEDIAPEIFLTDEEREDAASLLRRRSVSDDDIVVMVHPGTRGSAPNWSEEKYYKLISRILGEFQQPNLKIVLTAREMSREFLTKVAVLSSERVVNATPDIATLRDLIKVIGRADVFICSSTGPAHIADALNVRCIALHCHRAMSCARHWGILNGRSINLEVSAEYCRTHCSADQNTCVFEDGISIDQVIGGLRIFVNRAIVRVTI